MGQAKRRGSFEDRQAVAMSKDIRDQLVRHYRPKPQYVCTNPKVAAILGAAYAMGAGL